MRDIAIVGLSCRFPGARNVNQFWRLLLEARPQTSSVPSRRWNHDTFHAPGDRRAAHRSYTDQVSFLDEVEEFDPLHYGIPPKRARAMDPQHRLLVDLAREAIQDAGWEQRPGHCPRTSVIVGISSSDYRELSGLRMSSTMLADGSLGPASRDRGLLEAIERVTGEVLDPVQPASMTGCLANMGPCAVSNVFQLQGPAFAVDAACSSALVALHEAMIQIRAGVADAALVGGVFLNLTPNALVGFSRIGALSATGRCRPFDQAADGFVLGEGGSLALVRPLDDALAAGDRIYAVIRGVGISNDGVGGGPMTPDVGGQLAAMRAAYADARLEPGDVDVIEAHGTGTPVGDRVEVEALRILRQDTGRRRPCHLSSVKALIGHSLSAAGAAGLLKAALIAHLRTVPAQPALRPADPGQLDAAGLRVPQATQRPDAERSAPLRVAVSSFGFGGTNVHAVLEEHPRPVRRPTGHAWPFLITAGSLRRLAAHAAELHDVITEDPGLTVAALSRTLTGRAPLRARLGFVAASREELLTHLASAVRALGQGKVDQLAPGIWAAAAPRPRERRKLAFVFPGQGAQRVGMLRDLVAWSSTAAQRTEELVAAVENLAAAPTAPSPLLELLCGAASESAEDALTRTELCQPALGVAGVVAAELLADCGVSPDVVVGHSVGEFPAAAAAGAVDPGDATAFLARRGRAVAASGCPPGGMLAVQADADQAAALIGDLDDVWIGCHNHPRQVVATGGLGPLATLAARCRAAGVTASTLRVSHAFHSPWMSGADTELAPTLATMELAAPAAAYVSSVTGQRCDDAEQVRRSWREHCSSPVRFASAVRRAHDLGADIWLQVYGGQSLLSCVLRTVDASPAELEHGPVTLAALGGEPDDGRTLSATLARLAVLGVPIDFTPLFRDDRPELLTLPPSPLATKRYSVRRTADDRPVPHAPSRSGTARHAAPAAVDSPTPARVPVPPAGPARVSGAPPVGARAGTGGSRHVVTRDLQMRESAEMIDLVQLFREQVALLHNLNGAPVTRPADPLAITDPVDGFHGTALAAPTPVPGQAASVGAPALTGPAGRPAPHDRSGLPATTPATPLANGTAPPAGAVPAPGGPADQAAGGPVTGSPGVGGRFGGAGAESAADRTGFDLVADLISQVTAYPRDFIQPGHELKNHLGFDSIMMADLVTRARRRWPDLRMDPQMLQSVVTVQDLCGLLPVPAVDGGPVATAGRRAPESTARHQHPADAADVTAFPEVRAVVERGERAESMGIRNPYFLVHDGTIRDTTSIGSRELISFSSYNYLGLSGHPGIAAAISQAVDRYGSSVSAARILSGQRPIHVELDRRIADLTGTQDALTLVSGHATNVSVIGHLLGPGDLVLHDALAHDSIIGGCRLSGAHRQPFPHNDAEAIDALLREVRGRYRRVLIVIEGVYSMDGDIPDLPAIIEVKQRHGALLMIDEAHSIGVLGPHGGGVGEHFGIDRTLVDVWMGTLSKSFASCGGYVAGRRELIEYFRYTLPGFIYSAGMTPANTAAALAALEVMGAEPERLARLRARAGTLFGLLREAGLDTGVAGGATPIVPCVFGDSEQTLKVADLLLQAGVSVNPILYPAVEESAARLRFFVTAEHTPEQLETAAAALVEAARKTSNQPLADTFDSRVAASESRVAASESRVAASP